VDYIVKPIVPEMVRAKVAVFTDLHLQRLRIEQQGELLLESERKEKELKLVELRLASDRKYRDLADAVPHIIWTARPDGRVDYFNHRWFEYTGISAPQALSWLVAVDLDDRPKCEAAWADAVHSGTAFHVECRLRGSDGCLRWHLCRGVPEHGTGGQIVSWLGTLTDIEDQKRAHAMLAEFKGTLDVVLDAVLIFEPENWRFSYVNAGASVLLGYSHEELSRLRPVDFLAEHDEAAFRELVTRLHESSSPRIGIDTRCRRRDGREIPVEFSFQLVRVGDGLVVAIARDITDRKLAELEREHLYGEALDAIRARDEFLSLASHELGTPLTSVKLHLDGLLRLAGRGAQTAGPEFLPKLEMAARQVDKLSELISRLMDVSRIKAGRLRLELGEVDLSAVVNEVVARFRADAVKAGCAVTIHADAPVCGRWDPLRMEQVVTNLLTNAIKFGAGKAVQIDVSSGGGWARLAVRDQGIGISPEDIERVFQRFERAGAARTYAGMGLGLYIVRQIVEAHGGNVRVESRPGAGSTFHVDLPLEPPRPTPEP
jgi:PAS domain S-box-containing protein